jgi:hypothetical protein
MVKMLGDLDIQSRIHVLEDNVLLCGNQQFRYQCLFVRGQRERKGRLPLKHHFLRRSRYRSTFRDSTYSPVTPTCSLKQHLDLKIFRLSLFPWLYLCPVRVEGDAHSLFDLAMGPDPPGQLWQTPFYKRQGCVVDVGAEDEPR